MSDDVDRVSVTTEFIPKMAELLPTTGVLLEASLIRPAFVQLTDADGPVWVNPHYVAAIQPHPAGDHTYVWMANSHTMTVPGALLVPMKAIDVIALLNGDPA